MMLDLPELLLDVQTAAHAARKRHSLEDVLIAAGMPAQPRVDRERIVSRLVIDWRLTHADDIQAARDTVNKILTLANL
jgi:hypothetical protein